MKDFRITTKQISKAIEEQTGDAGIFVHVDKPNLYCYFYCDVESPLDNVRNGTIVYEARILSDLTLDQWVEEYKRIISIKY